MLFTHRITAISNYCITLYALCIHQILSTANSILVRLLWAIVPLRKVSWESPAIAHYCLFLPLSLEFILYFLELPALYHYWSNTDRPEGKKRLGMSLTFCSILLHFISSLLTIAEGKA